MASRNEILNDPIVAMTAALNGRQANIWTALPGFVTKVDLATMTVSVQPTIKAKVSNEAGQVTSVNLPVLINVPIIFPKAGGFALTFPVKVDDECLVIFSCRSIDSWWQSGGIQEPIEQRMHDLSDGFAIFGVSSQPNVLENISATDVQLRNESGSTFVSVTADNKIKMKASDIEIEGNVSVIGTVKAGASVPTQVSLTTHVHTSATPGNPTSAPTPGT